MTPLLLIAIGAVWAVLIVIALSLARIAARADLLVERCLQAEALRERAAESLRPVVWGSDQASEWEREAWVPRVVETTAHVYELSDWRRDGAA